MKKPVRERSTDDPETLPPKPRAKPGGYMDTDAEVDDDDKLERKKGVVLDKEWDATDMLPAEFARYKSAEKSLKTAESALEKLKAEGKELLKEKTTWKTRLESIPGRTDWDDDRKAEATALTTNKLEQFRKQIEAAKAGLVAYQSEIDVLRKTMQDLKERHAKWEKKDDEPDTDEERDSEDDIVDNAATEEEAAEGLEAHRKNKTSRERKRKQSSLASVSHDGPGLPEPIETGALLAKAKVIKQRSWSKDFANEFDEVLEEIGHALVAATQQTIGNKDWNYAYRYTTPKGMWEVSAAVRTTTKKDKKGRDVPDGEMVHIALHGPPTVKLHAPVAYSDMLSALWSEWETVSEMGIHALSGFTAGLATQEARDAARLAFMVMLACFPMRYPSAA